MTDTQLKSLFLKQINKSKTPSAFTVIASLFFILLVIGLIVVVPIVMIWSLNVLFPVLAIPFTIKTYFAMVILSGTLFSGKVVSTGKK